MRLIGICLFFALNLSAAGVYPVAALCNGQDEAPAFAAAIAAAYAGGGGLVVAPGGKSCRAEGIVLASSNTSELETPINLTSDGGPYGTTLYCNTCAVLITVGLPGKITYNKTVSNLVLNMTASTNSYSNGILWQNVIRPFTYGLSIVNSKLRNHSTAMYFYNTSVNGSCTFPGGTGVCFGAHGNFLGLNVNGIFDYGVRIQGERTASNDNNNHHNFYGGQFVITKNCTSGLCVGAYVESADTIHFDGTDIEDGHIGFYLRGNNHKLTNTRTENNQNWGVYTDDIGVQGGPTPAYNTLITGGSHGDKVSLCQTCSMIETYNESQFAVTIRRGVRSINPTSLLASCTTAGTAGSTCSFIQWLPKPFPNGVNNYGATCTLTNPTGVPTMVGTSQKTSQYFTVTIVALTNQPASATVDCDIRMPNSQ